jgi:hypothetical protein
METLNALFQRADDALVLQPLGVRQIKHLVSLYADDFIIFCAPVAADLNLVSGIFQLFGEASRLWCNYSKCQIAPNRCDEEQIGLATEFLPCMVVEFRIRYLGHSFIDGEAAKIGLVFPD